VPPDLTAPARDSRYQVPEPGRGATTLSGYQAGRAQQARPGTESLLPAIEGMRIERDGDQRWLVVNRPPEALWPVLKSFWQENGLLIARELPEAGVMETGWAENRAKIPDSWIRRTLGSLIEPLHSTAERDKYRVRLEPAPGWRHRDLHQPPRAGGGVRERGGPADRLAAAAGRSRPGGRVPAPAHGAARRARGRGARESRAAQPAPQRAVLTKGVDGEPQLEVREPFDRAWRRVGLALDRVGFTVEDRDRQKGVYFVRYADPEAELGAKKKGLLSRLAFWRDDKAEVKASSTASR
jgi:outer membrane protein assembly factor BamC